MRIRAAGFALGLACCASCATVGTGVQDVEALERSRFTAMTAQDVGALEPMLADDLVYCHSNGACETKAQFLETIHSGRIRYQVMKVLELRPRAVGGDAVVVNGSVAVDGLMGGQARSFTIVFTDVYAQRSGRWQLTAWQSTQLP